MIPSLDDVTMNPCVVWKVAMSVMMSWCPTGSDSGPRRGESSAAPLFCLLWISWDGGGRQAKPHYFILFAFFFFFSKRLLTFSRFCGDSKYESQCHDVVTYASSAYLHYLGAFNDLPAVQDGWAVQRIVGPARHDVRPLRVRQVPEPEKRKYHNVFKFQFRALNFGCRLFFFPGKKNLKKWKHHYKFAYHTWSSCRSRRSAARDCHPLDCSRSRAHCEATAATQDRHRESPDAQPLSNLNNAK